MLAFPKPTQAEQRTKDAARQQGLILYEQVQQQLQAGDLSGAVQAINPFSSPLYYAEAIKAVALAQVQADDLLAAVAIAQRLPYPDTRGEVVRTVIEVLVQRGDIEKAAERAGKTLGQYLNDDVRGFAQGQLSQAEATGQAVASPRDLQVQGEQLAQLVEGIAARMAEPARKGFWQRVFGK